MLRSSERQLACYAATAVVSTPVNVCVPPYPHLWLDSSVHLLAIPQVHPEALEGALTQRHAGLVILLKLDKQLNALQLLLHALQAQHHTQHALLFAANAVPRLLLLWLHDGHAQCSCLTLCRHYCIITALSDQFAAFTLMHVLCLVQTLQHGSCTVPCQHCLLLLLTRKRELRAAVGSCDPKRSFVLVYRFKDCMTAELPLSSSTSGWGSLGTWAAAAGWQASSRPA